MAISGGCQFGAGLFYVNETFLPGLVDMQSVTLDEPSAFAPDAQVQTAEQTPGRPTSERFLHSAAIPEWTERSA